MFEFYLKSLWICFEIHEFALDFLNFFWICFEIHEFALKFLNFFWNFFEFALKSMILFWNFWNLFEVCLNLLWNSWIRSEIFEFFLKSLRIYLKRNIFTFFLLKVNFLLFLSKKFAFPLFLSKIHFNVAFKNNKKTTKRQYNKEDNIQQGHEKSDRTKTVGKEQKTIWTKLASTHL